MLPFWWDIDKSDVVSSCSDSQAKNGQVELSTMKCKFTVSNSNKKTVVY